MISNNLDIVRPVLDPVATIHPGRFGDAHSLTCHYSL